MPFNASHFPKDAEWFVFKVSEDESFRTLIKRIKDDAAFRRLLAASDKSDKALGEYCRYLADNVLVDWDGVTTVDGAPLTATAPEKLHWLRDWRAFREHVFVSAFNEAGYLGNVGNGHVSSDTGTALGEAVISDAPPAQTSA